MKLTERQKRDIWQYSLFGLVLICVAIIEYLNVEEKFTSNDPALTGSIVYTNNFNSDCLNVWVKSTKTTEIVVDSVTFYITSIDDGVKALQIIKSNNPQQIGEEMFFVQTPSGWQREIGPATDEDIEMMSMLNKKIKNP